MKYITPIDQEIVRCWLMLIFVGFDPSNEILFFYRWCLWLTWNYLMVSLASQFKQMKSYEEKFTVHMFSTYNIKAFKTKCKW